MNFHDETFHSHLNDNMHANHNNINEFLLYLALCHTVIHEERNRKSIYEASSPDELALVNAAKLFGVTYMGKDTENNILIGLKDGRL